VAKPRQGRCSHPPRARAACVFRVYFTHSTSSKHAANNGGVRSPPLACPLTLAAPIPTVRVSLILRRTAQIARGVHPVGLLGLPPFLSRSLAPLHRLLSPHPRSPTLDAISSRPRRLARRLVQPAPLGARSPPRVGTRRSGVGGAVRSFVRSFGRRRRRNPVPVSAPATATRGRGPRMVVG
jgi:hypothetical protein